MAGSLLPLYPQTYLDKSLRHLLSELPECLFLGGRCWSLLLFLASLKILGDCTVSVFLLHVLQERPAVYGQSWALWTRAWFIPWRYYDGECVTLSRSRRVLKHAQKILTRRAWCQRSGDGEGGKGLSKLLGKLRNGTESQFSDQAASKFHRHSSHQGSRQQGSPCEPWKVPLAGRGVLLAGREKTFLNSLTPSDKITTVQTSRSCNKVLSSHRGDVRSCLLWAGFLFLVCYVKSQKDFPFALQYC